MKNRLVNYGLLMRLDKPIGTLLLLWPTLWGLWLAAKGTPKPKHFLILCLGVFIMRSAGCIANDIADKAFDPYVARTASRPLAKKAVTVYEAYSLLCALLFSALMLILPFGLQLLWLACFALGFALIYPYMKRITGYPQLILAIAFSFGILFAFVLETSALPWQAWILCLANMCWVVAFDTAYAMSDKEDDLVIGLKSTAITFGKYDLAMIAFCQLLMLVLLVMLGIFLKLGFYFYFFLCMSLSLFVYQQYLIRDRNPILCFKAFLHNQWVGLMVWLGFLTASY